MYGTIARVKVQKAKIREFFALGKEWDDRERKRAIGFLGADLLWEDRDEGSACLIVRFIDRESYLANANSAEQDKFYRRMRECLTNDPEWIDGEYGRWDDAHARPPKWATAEPR